MDSAVLRPFQREKTTVDGGAYHYFDFGRIAGGLSVSEEEYARALELVNEGRYESPISTEFGYNDFYSSGGGCVGQIAVRFPEGNGQIECSFRFSRDRILGGRCGCQTRNPYGLFQRTAKLCRHQAATLLLLERYIDEHDPGDSTDAVADRFLTAFRRTTVSSRIMDEEPAKCSVRLEPRLNLEKDGLRLSFKVGEDRMYVVRKLTELADAPQSGVPLSFGKTYELDLSRTQFEEESAPYYSLIRKYVEDERRRSGGDTAIKAEIPLYGSVLDEFFEIANGRVLPFREGKQGETDTEITVTEGDPPVELTVKKDVAIGNVFQGARVEGRLPKLYEGAEHRYYIGDGCLYRVSDGFVRDLRPLYELGSGGKVDFHVGRKHLSELYYTVLPALRDRVTIREPDDEQIQSHLPPELALSFYLDAERGVPRCRVEARYGDSVYSPRDWERQGFGDRNMRDEFREREAAETVRRYFPHEEQGSEDYICDHKEEAVYEALRNGIPEMQKLGEVLSTDRLRSIGIKRKIKLAVGVSVENDLMELELSSRDVPQQELLDLLASYRLKRKYHRLKDGSFVELDDSVAELDMMNEALQLTPKELIEGKAHIPAYRALYLDKMLEQCDSVEAVRDKRFRTITKDFRTVNDSDFDVPPSLRDIMRSYQQYGYKWLRTIAAYGFGGILADDMGLGKTLQMISVLLAAKEEGQEGTSIVITPASLVYNWKEELEKFAPSLRACTVAGSQAERRSVIEHYTEYDVLITSYDLLKRDLSYYEDSEFLYQVIDEAQYIKNQETSAARSVKLIKSRTRFALTGTPIENRLSELWSIFDYLMPGFLYSYETFRREFEVPVAQKGNDSEKQRLRRMISPFILRRLKTEVLKELPEKLEETRFACFGTEQQRLYDAQLVHMREMLKSSGDEQLSSKRMEVLAELTRIRQICCDPALLFEGYEGGSAKREACMELIENAIEGEHRILLFSQFTSMLDLLAADLRERGIEYYTITGSVSKAERLSLVRRFNEGNVPVFLISLKAGGTGLNLTGADVVIHYDPWWNMAAQNQATDRTHRIGQQRTVTVYKLIAKDTVEEKIQTMQTSKRDLADAVLSGDSVRLSDMTKDDLLALLEGHPTAPAPIEESSEAVPVPIKL